MPPRGPGPQGFEAVASVFCAVFLVVPRAHPGVEPALPEPVHVFVPSQSQYGVDSVFRKGVLEGCSYSVLAEKDVNRGFEVFASTFEYCIVMFESFVVFHVISMTCPYCKESSKFLPVQEGKFICGL